MSPSFKTAAELKKETLAISVQRPVAVYPATVGALAAAYSAAFGLSLVSGGLMAAGLLVGFGGWAIEYFVNGDKYGLEIVTKHRESLEVKRKKALKSLARELDQIGSDSGVNQLHQLKAKFENFENLLRKKLNPSELAYNRYLSMAEQVYLNALDNLEHLTTGIQSVSAIDIHSVEKRLEELSEQSDEYQALMDRKGLWEKQQARANKFLVDNEFAMTQIDHVSAKLAEVVTKSGRAQMDMELAMSELKDLIIKADKYSVN